MRQVEVLSPGVLQALKNEALRAHLKHGPHGGSLLDPALGPLSRLAALMEEVGEVAHCLTYDGEDAVQLHKELIQVANVAMTWAQSIGAPNG